MSKTSEKVALHKQPNKSHLLSRVCIILVSTLGTSTLLYPTAAAWVSDITQNTEITGYVEAVNNSAPSEQDEQMRLAHAFNVNLPAGPLRDPYALDEGGREIPIGTQSESYDSLLAVGADGMMGTLNIPAIRVNLPIYHGTSEATLNKGVGHLVGSSLPVGGNNTHSVLTTHSGAVHSTLFDNLKEMKLGDTFSVTIFNKSIHYKVDSIDTYLPDQTESLRQVANRDFITLVTCTPTGVNSHRLLVRGARVPDPNEDELNSRSIPHSEFDPGFPWWAAAIVLTALVTARLTRTGKHCTPPATRDASQ